MADYHYSICTEADESIFNRQCAALEANIPGIRALHTLNDVDGSTTRVYDKGGATIEVHNSEYIGAVYVDSDIELTQFFKH